MKPCRPCRRSAYPHLAGLGLLVAALAAPAADVSRYIVAKGQFHQQTNTGSPVLQGYVMNVDVQKAGPTTVTNAHIKSPANVTNFLSEECQSWNYENFYASQALLDAAFGNGSYTLTLFTRFDGVRAPVVSVTNNVYPANAPHVTNYTAAQSINPGTNFALGWDPFTGGTVNDFIRLEVRNENGGRVFETGWPGEPGALNGLSNQVNFSAGTLPPGHTNQAQIFFARGNILTNNPGYPGVLGLGGYFKATALNLRTTGVRDSNAPAFYAPIPSYAGTNVFLKSAIVFSFDEPMEIGHGIAWTGVDPDKFTCVWMNNRQTLACFYATILPAYTLISWELNPTNGCGSFNDISGNVAYNYAGAPCDNFGALCGSFTTGTNASDPDVEFFFVAKVQNFLQTGTNAPAPPTNGHTFFANATLTGTLTITNATVQPPTGLLRTLGPSFDGDLTDFQLEQSFTNQSSLDTAFTNGPYTVTLWTRFESNRVATLNLTNNAYPAATPRISNFNELQNLDATRDFVLKWDAFVGGTTNDLIRVALESGQTAGSFDTDLNPASPDALNGTHTSVLIPAGSLRPGQTYEGNLVFAKRVDRNTTAYPGVTGYAFFGKDTAFTLQLRPVLTEPERLSATEFRFLLNGVGGKIYTVEAATSLTNPPAWFPIETIVAPSNSFYVTDPDATNAMHYYRAYQWP